jgi:N-acetylneuraminic acid mutarotase
VNALIRSRALCCLAAVTLCLSLLGCYKVFDNPADPLATDYQGYPTVNDVSEVAPGYPSSGESLGQGSSIELLVSKVLTADEYGAQVSLTSSPFEDGIVVELTGSTNRLTVPKDMAFPGLFSWRAKAKATGGDWGPWSSQVGQYYVLALGPTISGWTTSTALPSSRDSASSVASRGYVYVLGGYGSSAFLSEVLYAAANGDGSLGSWQSTTSLPSGRHYHSSVVSGGYVYVLGGYGDSGSLSEVLYAAVNGDGSLGSWQSTTSLPSGRSAHSSVVSGGYVYVLGGGDSDYLSEVLYAAVNGDGSLGSWQSATGLPTGRYWHSSVVLGGYVYVLGGQGQGESHYLSEVLYAAVKGDGSLGSWQSATGLPSGRAYHSSVVSEGYVYVLGGNGLSGPLPDVLYAAVNEDGSLGSWQSTLSLPQGGSSGSVVCGNHLYAFGLSGVCFGSFDQQSYGGSPVLAEVVLSPDERLIVDSLDVTLSDPVASASINYTTDGSTPTPYSGTSLANGGTVTVTEPCTLKAVAYIANVATSPVASTVFYRKAAAPTFSPSSGVFSGSAAVALSTTSTGASIYYTLDGSTPDAVTGTPYTGPIMLYTQTTILARAGGGAWLDSEEAVKTYGPAGEVGVWRNTAALPTWRLYHSSAVSGSWLYAIGGLIGSERLADVLSAEVSDSGNLLGWQTNTSLPFGRSEHSSVACGGYVYVIGGYDGSSYLSDVSYALVNEGGALGSWHSTASLSQGRIEHGSVASGGFLYVIGGIDYAWGYTDSVVRAAPNSDGSLVSWESATSLPSPRCRLATVARGNYVYAIGGMDNSGNASSDVFYAHVNVDGSLGTWQSTAILLSPRYSSTAEASGGYIYVIGGYDGSSYFADVLYAPVNGDGSLGDWGTATGRLPSGRFDHASACSGRFLYALGGQGSAENSSEVLVADIVQ